MSNIGYIFKIISTIPAKNRIFKDSFRSNEVESFHRNILSRDWGASFSYENHIIDRFKIEEKAKKLQARYIRAILYKIFKKIKKVI